MLKKDIKYSYRDVTIVPAKVSEIEHRKDCNPFYPSGTLPLFTAPMDSVVGLENYELYEQHKIIPIIPRTVSLEQRLEVAKTGRWGAYSLDEFEKIFTVQNPGEGYKALIDVANGHMKKLYTLVKKAKALNPNLTVMIGNIANPETYEECCKAGVDYVRCGIGSGECCITSSATKIHFPLASLISEIVEKKQSLQWSGSYKKFTKIIADGGVRGYSDAIVALALGADYVMIGSVFSKMLESSGQIFFRYKDYEKENDWYPLNWDIYFNRYKSGKFYDFNEYWKGTSEIGDHWRPIELKKEIYGMASGKGQIAIGGKKTKTSEGIIKTIPIEYTMDSWTENFISYLRSAMSYTGAKDLNTFINKTTCIINSPLSVASVNA